MRKRNLKKLSRTILRRPLVQLGMKMSRFRQYLSRRQKIRKRMKRPLKVEVQKRKFSLLPKQQLKSQKQGKYQSKSSQTGKRLKRMKLRLKISMLNRRLKRKILS